MLWSVLLAAASTPRMVAQQPTEAVRSGIVTGRALDALGEPVPACRVWLEKARDAAGHLADGLTDGEGVFVIRGPLDQGALRVHAAAPFLASDSTVVVLSGAEPRAFVDLRLWDAGVIRGRILDRSGVPVADAEVVAGRDVEAARSDDEGHFVLQGVPLGAVRLAAWKDGFGCARASLWLRDDADRDLTLPAADEALELEVGVVGLPDGVTARFSLRAVEGVGRPHLPASLIDGLAATWKPWNRSGLPALRFEIRPRAEGYVMEPAMAARGPAGASHVAVFRARPLETDTPDRDHRLRGRVVDRVEDAVAGVAVLCLDPSTGLEVVGRTGADGAFDLPSPAPLRTVCTVALLDPEWAIAEIHDEGAAREPGDHVMWADQFLLQAGSLLRIEVAPPSTVRGRLVDEAGDALPFRRVWLRELGPGRSVGPADARGMQRRIWPFRDVTWSDRRGAFEFTGHWPRMEPHVLMAGVAPDDSARTREFAVPVGGTLDDVELVLPRLGSVEGQVVDEDGDPVPGASVELLSWSMTVARGIEGQPTRVRADREGRFRFVEVLPGRQLLTVRLMERTPVWSGENFVLKPGARIERPIRLQ